MARALPTALAAAAAVLLILAVAAYVTQSATRRSLRSPLIERTDDAPLWRDASRQGRVRLYLVSSM